MTYLPIIEHKTFMYEHLFASDENQMLIKDFAVKNPAGHNLVRFLKELAANNENMNADRTYLVKDKVTHEIVGFFALRNGLFGLRVNDNQLITIPSVELSNFAVNDNYRQKYPQIKKLGETLFRDFIIPVVKFIQSVSGVQALYIYALPQERLLEHYHTFGFSRLAADDEKYIYDSVKPAYDEECIFMYQIL